MTLMTAYTYLGLAIMFEVVATSALKASDSFSRLWPTLLTISSYVAAFFLLSLTLRVLPTGVAYAIWAGVGIVLISVVSWFWFKQTLDFAAMSGMALIISGVVVINVFSNSTSH